jgi:hypothetical protein
MARAATSFVLLQPTRVVSAPTLMIGSIERVVHLGGLGGVWANS